MGRIIKDALNDWIEPDYSLANGEGWKLSQESRYIEPYDDLVRK